MIQNFILKLDWPTWIFSLLSILLIAVSFYYYFRTIPPLSKTRRTISILLRSLGLVIIFFLLLRPIVELIFKKNEKPTIAFLFDNSASMKIADNYGQRGDSLKYIISQLPVLSKGDSLILKPYKFDNILRPLAEDSIGFNVDGTNISNALSSITDSLSGKNLQGVVLISDGIYNQGISPIIISQNSPVKIHTVLIGDTITPPDVSIRRIQSNPVTYLDKEVPVEVTIWQNGYDGKKAQVSIYDGKQRVAVNSVTIGKSGFEQKTEIKLVPKRLGDVSYQVKIEDLPGEKTLKNNRQILNMTILKSKLQVVVFSGNVNFDLKALKFIADRLKDLNFSFLAEKESGQFFGSSFENVQLDSVDLFVFQGFPSKITSREQLQKIFQMIEQRKIPVFWMLNRFTDLKRLAGYSASIPFVKTGQFRELENVFVTLTSGGLLHPVIRLEESESSNQLIWSELPPVEIYYQLQLKPGQQVLLETGSLQQPAGNRPVKYPVLSVYREKKFKHLIFAASNFGFWHYQLQEDLNRDQFLQIFIDRAIRWLANREDINQVQIKPVRQAYNLGDQVQFMGQVYDEFYQPVTDARVTISVDGHEINLTDEAIMGGGGHYWLNVAGLPEGEFEYRVVAEKKGQKIGERTGKINIAPFNLEFQQIAGNGHLMHQIARNAQGQFYSPKMFVNQFSDLKLENRIRYSETEYFLWSYLHWLFVLILLLAVEWFLRKRWGLL
jgi:hypothetical protein